MAQGRRDYTMGFLSETGTGARYTLPYLAWYPTVINPVTTVTIYQYTIPAGKRLAVNRLMVSSDSPVINYFQFLVDGVAKMGGHFTNFIDYPISDQNPYYINAGELFKFNVRNNHKDACTFYITMVGCIETL